jgi:hypothetical protein
LTNDGELSFDFPPETFASIAVQEGAAIVCPKGHTPLVVDLTSMKVVQELEAIGESTVKRIAADHRGRVAILSTNGNVWIVSRDAEQTDWSVTKPNLPGQGDAATLAFDAKDRLWMSHAVKSVEIWSSDLSASEKSYRPRSTTPEQIFSYIINPLYMIFPKPSAINQTIQYALKNPESKLPAMNNADLDIPQIELDPWQPIWSNAIFIAVMLSLGCWHLYRQDL